MPLNVINIIGQLNLIMEKDRFELSSTYIANITDYQLSNFPYNKIIK